MTMLGTERLVRRNFDIESRDFDYGVGDDVHNAVEQMRAEIATRIRQAAVGNRMASSEARAVYEMAARIVEAAH